MPFLGEVPLLLDIRETSDAGTPIVAQAPDSPAARAYAEIADRLWAGLGGERSGGPADHRRGLTAAASAPRRCARSAFA